MRQLRLFSLSCLCVSPSWAAIELHRGIVLADPIGALAHWKLGQAYVISGDTTMAKSAYRDFLALRKDADGDIPVLKQAREEYAKL